MRESPALIGVHEPFVLAVDLGGSNTRLTRKDGERIGRVTKYDTPVDYERALTTLAVQTQVLFGGRRPDAVGIGVAAKVAHGRLVSAGKLEENGWIDLPFAEDVAAALDVPAGYLLLDNDANAGADAERRARLNVQMGAFLADGTGLGGAWYFPEGTIPDEPGHYDLKPGALCGCGQDGHIEAHIGGAGIEAKYGQRGETIPHSDPRWREITQDFQDGIGLTLVRYEGEGRYPEVVSFTGSVVLGGPNLLGGLRDSLQLQLGDQAPRIEEAVYGADSALYGMAFAAADLLRAA
jgi:predicted NBD/HSP70 family sugar kinase